MNRLEAEAIRDSLLAAAGELQDQMYGPPVTGGTPRRSVYVRIKRNDLDPFLAAAPCNAGGVAYLREIRAEARLHWSRCLLLDPDNAQARQGLQALEHHPL